MSATQIDENQVSTIQRGVALVELALVLPLVLLISLAGLESVGLLAAQQAATQLSRELATMAFRQCAAKSTANRDSNACLEDVLLSFGAQSSQVAPGAEVQLSLYNLIAGSTQLIANKSIGNSASEFNIYSFDRSHSNTALSRGLNDMIDNYQIALVAEIFVEPGSIPGTISPFYFFWQESIYASTIM